MIPNLHSFPTRRSSDLDRNRRSKSTFGLCRGDHQTIQQVLSTPYQSPQQETDRKSTRLNSSHQIISYAVFCLKKKKRKWTLMMCCTLIWLDGCRTWPGL